MEELAWQACITKLSRTNERMDGPTDGRTDEPKNGQNKIRVVIENIRFAVLKKKDETENLETFLGSKCQHQL